MDKIEQYLYRLNLSQTQNNNSNTNTEGRVPLIFFGVPEILLVNKSGFMNKIFFGHRFIQVVFFLIVVSIRQSASPCFLKAATQNFMFIQNRPDTAVPATINFRKVRKIEVLSISKELTGHDTADIFFKQCSRWKLAKTQFLAVIREFKSMSSEVQYLVYSYHECRMKGEIAIDRKKYRYWLNAGATLVLMDSANNRFYYGCAGEKCIAYFISVEDKPEKP